MVCQEAARKEPGADPAASSTVGPCAGNKHPQLNQQDLPACRISKPEGNTEPFDLAPRQSNTLMSSPTVIMKGLPRASKVRQGWERATQNALRAPDKGEPWRDSPQCPHPLVCSHVLEVCQQGTCWDSGTPGQQAIWKGPGEKRPSSSKGPKGWENGPLIPGASD